MKRLTIKTDGNGRLKPNSGKQSPKKKYSPLTLDTICPFPKYKGQLMQDVIEWDPRYVEWLMENVGLELDNAAFAFFQARQ